MKWHSCQMWVKWYTCSSATRKTKGGMGGGLQGAAIASLKVFFTNMIVRTALKSRSFFNFHARKVFWEVSWKLLWTSKILISFVADNYHIQPQILNRRMTNEKFYGKCLEKLNWIEAYCQVQPQLNTTSTQSKAEVCINSTLSSHPATQPPGIVD